MNKENLGKTQSTEVEFGLRSLLQLDQEQNINDTAEIFFASTKKANTIAQNRPSLIRKETSTVTNDGFSSLPFGTKISNTRRQNGKSANTNDEQQFGQTSRSIIPGFYSQNQFFRIFQDY